MSDDNYYRNELALAGLDAWITREPEYDDGPEEPEPCCPEFSRQCGEYAHDRCDRCNGCETCDRARDRNKYRVTEHRPILNNDDEVPF